MSKVLISGYYGFKNFGDETILKVLVEHLKSLNADITVLSSDIDYTKSSHNVNAVSSFNLKSVIKEIKNCDILISGGGSLLQDVTSLKSLVYYSFIIALAKLFKKKIIIFAQGIGPLNRKFSQILVKNILKSCNYISVRDLKSFELLKNWEINSKLVCDPVFSLKLERKNKEKIIGIQLREFKNINYNLLNKLAQLINNKFQDYKVNILSLQKSYDYDISEKFLNLLKQFYPNINAEIVTNNIIDEISKLSYLFAMRYHAILIAIKAGVKTCAINYDIKVEQIAKNSGIPTVSPNATENFEKIYQDLFNINPDNLIKYSNSNTFDWSEFDKLFV